MTGLRRRDFLAIAGGMSATWALPIDAVAGVLAQEAQPAEVETTLVGTIRKQRVKSFYQPLAPAPGESILVREDLLLEPPPAGRANTRRSLLYLGQLTDIHVIDAQSPARTEPLQKFSQTLESAGACRPQETTTLHVLNQMVVAMNRAASSPVTGAPLAFALVTGDSADSHATTELDWYVGMLDGKSMYANSGKPGVYEGVQVWGEATYAYHPDDPSDDIYGKHDFPKIPGMLDAAVGTKIESAGLNVPWYAVYGNHDTLWLGTTGVSWAQTQMAKGSRKFSTFTSAMPPIIAAGSATSLIERQLLSGMMDNVIGVPGIRPVTPDPERKLFELEDFMKVHLDSPADPGPKGHGFTEENLKSGQTWWKEDFDPGVRLIGMNTCNVTEGADGSMPEDEYVWLERQLRAVSSRYFDADGNEQRQDVDDKLVLVCSHHTSWTMGNVVQGALTEQTRLYTGDELVALLLRYPNVIGWINGHTHYNDIRAHPNPYLGRGAGFWEINTASCIDWGQQSRLIEVVDNQDGTVSIFGVVLDHASAPTADLSDLSVKGLASIGRELAANHWFQIPDERLGSRQDRNVELPVKAPFDLSKITAAEVQAAQMKRKARLLSKADTGSGSAS